VKLEQVRKMKDCSFQAVENKQKNAQVRIEEKKVKKD
jgi:hypothetical protein